MGATFALPWLFTAAAAAWLGFVAWKTGRSWIGWATGAAVVTVMVSTIIVGLAHAASIPYSDRDEQAFLVKTAICVAIVLLIVAGLITWVVLRSANNRPGPPAPPQ